MHQERIQEIQEKEIGTETVEIRKAEIEIGTTGIVTIMVAVVGIITEIGTITVDMDEGVVGEGVAGIIHILMKTVEEVVGVDDK